MHVAIYLASKMILFAALDYFTLFVFGAHDWPEFRGATGSGIRRQWVCRFAVMESQSHE
jgi:hypothetical protein